MMRDYELDDEFELEAMEHGEFGGIPMEKLVDYGFFNGTPCCLDDVLVVARCCC